MKQTLPLCAFFAISSLCSAAATLNEGSIPGEWTHDFEAARTRAQSENKYLFVNFTGSDWCGWCKLMDEHVFSKSGWKTWAAQNLSLAIIDTPSAPALVPEKYRARNQALKKEFGIRGFPTFVMLAPDGHEAGRLNSIRSGNEFSFITNVTAVIVEDKIAEFLSPDELAEYRHAQADKAAWEEKNAATQSAFQHELAEPNRKAAYDTGREIDAILAKATEAWRAARPAVDSATAAAPIRCSDFGAGVMTNGAAIGAWTSDFAAARKLARETGRDLLLAFVGPAWCEWGNQMESNVFNTVAWMNFARNHFVQVYIDCPGDENAYHPDAPRNENVRLYQAYEMKGCPLYLLTDADGRRYDAFGATNGIKPAEQIRIVETMLARKNLAQWLSAADFSTCTNLVARKRALDEQWRNAYDAFIAQMDEQAQEFEPIAARRNRLFTKALDAYFKLNADK